MYNRGNRGVVRWLEKCESKVRYHQISEAVLLWRGLIKELSGNWKWNKICYSTDYDPRYGWLTWPPLTESRGGGYFLEWVFWKVYARKRKKRRRKHVLLGLFCHFINENIISEMSAKKSTSLLWILAILANFPQSHLPHSRMKTRRAVLNVT